MQGHAWCQIALLELGDVTRLDLELDAYDRLAQDLRQPRYRWYAMSRRAMRALLAGDLDGGEVLVRKARQLGREAGEPDAENVFSTQMFAVWEDRPSPEGVAVFDAVCEAAEGTVRGESPLVLGVRLMRLLLMLDTAACVDARRELAGLLEPAVDRLDPTYYGMGWAILAVLLSTAATRLSVAEASETLYELLLPYAGLACTTAGPSPSTAPTRITSGHWRLHSAVGTKPTSTSFTPRHSMRRWTPERTSPARASHGAARSSAAKSRVTPAGPASSSPRRSSPPESSAWPTSNAKLANWCHDRVPARRSRGATCHDGDVGDGTADTDCLIVATYPPPRGV